MNADGNWRGLAHLSRKSNQNDISTQVPINKSQQIFLHRTKTVNTSNKGIIIYNIETIEAVSETSISTVILDHKEAEINSVTEVK